MRPIGVVHSPFREAGGTPIQPRFGQGVRGHVIVDEPYVDGLADLEGFERIWLLFQFDRSRPSRMQIVPYRDTQKRGLFATRAPSRPNPIGLSPVRLLGREGARLDIMDVDILDGTPLLDIKPYIPRFDAHPNAAAGWLDELGEAREQADDRFHR